MHYYQHNIGDYRRDTSHLSLLEHGIYRQLMDWYYLEEAPIPKETEVVFRRLRATTEVETKAVLSVLADFFQLTEKGYIQSRCDEEIHAYHVKADTARENGKTGGRPRKTNPVSGRNPAGTDNKPKRKLTNKPINPSEEDKSSSEDLRCADFIFQKIEIAVPGTKAPKLDKWANTIRLMREQDSLTHHRIVEVFVWANKDPFWKTNILSPDKLREKFPVLAVKLEESRGQRNPDQRSSRQTPTERALAAADAVFGTRAGQGEVLEGDFALVDQHAPAH